MAASDPLDVVAMLYRAVTDVDLWPTALDRYAEAVGAMGALVVPYSGSSLPLSSVSLTESVVDYNRTWREHDTRIARGKELNLKPGTVGTESRLIDPHDYRHDPFYQEFLRPNGFGDFAFMVASFEGEPVSISAQRDLRRGPFEQGEVDMKALLAPHVATAFKASIAFSDARRIASDQDTVLDHLDVAMIRLDAKGRCRHVNMLAQRLMGGGIDKGPDGCLIASSMNNQRGLDALIASALSRSGIGPSPAVLLADPQGGPALHVEAIPVQPDALRLPSGFDEGGVMLLVRSLSRSGVEPLMHLRRLGLTPTEARVASFIGQGRSPAEAATEFGLSEGTINVHLRSIYSKLDIRRQSQLAVLVTRLSSAEIGHPR